MIILELKRANFNVVRSKEQGCDNIFQTYHSVKYVLRVAMVQDGYTCL